MMQNNMMCAIKHNIIMSLMPSCCTTKHLYFSSREAAFFCEINLFIKIKIAGTDQYSTPIWWGTGESDTIMLLVISCGDVLWCKIRWASHRNWSEAPTEHLMQMSIHFRSTKLKSGKCVSGAASQNRKGTVYDQRTLFHLNLTQNWFLDHYFTNFHS